MPRHREHRQALAAQGRAGKTARHSAALQASKRPLGVMVMHRLVCGLGQPGSRIPEAHLKRI